MGRPLHPVWEKFHRKAEKGINGDKHHHEARCKACVAQRVAIIRAADISRAATSNGEYTARTEDQIQLELLAPKDLQNPTQQDEPARIAGKIDDLLKHIATCKNVSAADQVQAKLQQVQKSSGKENVPTTPARSAAAAPSRVPLQPFNSAATLVDHTQGSNEVEERPLKYRRLDDTHIADVETGVVYVALSSVQAWTRERIDRFSSMLCRLMVVCNIAWWAVENPYWRHFFDEWLPGAPMPGRAELSGRVLDREAEECAKEMQRHVGGRFATGQCDGWKDTVRSAIVAMMFNVEYMPWLTNTADLSREQKNAENLLKHVVNEVDYAMQRLNIVVVAWCTDCSGESAKMRRLLVDKFSWIVSLDCWAHQINLVVGDMLKVSNFKRMTNDALALVKWFNSHSLALGMLRAVSLEKLNEELALILPVITRWTSHYLCVQRLLQLERAFKQLVLDSEEALVRSAGSRPDAMETAKKMVSKIKRETFWDGLRRRVRIKQHLEPLAQAANVTQSDCARLDVVLITLANLYHYFSTTPGLNGRAAAAVLSSLETRWAKVDQDIFLLAVVFNPYIRTSCFAENSPFRLPAHIRRMAEIAFQRFYGVEPSDGFRTELRNYLSRTGNWSDNAMDLSGAKDRAKAQGNEVNLLDVWAEWSPLSDKDGNGIPKNGAAQLALLARRILSMVPNSTSVERIFSIFGFVHTKHRNRLHKDKVRKIVQVRVNTARHFPLAQGARKRQFGDIEGSDDDEGEDSPAPAPQPETDIEEGQQPANPEGMVLQPTAQNEETRRAHELDFETIADGLMAEADELNAENGPAPAPRLAAIEETDRRLQNLFAYPAVGENTKTYRVLTHYWRVGVRNLEREAQYQQEEYAATHPLPEMPQRTSL